MDNSGKSAGTVLFVCAKSKGPFNPLRTLASELSDRGVCGLSFVTHDERRADVATIPNVGFVSMGSGAATPAPEDWDEATMRTMTSGSAAANVAAFVDRLNDADTVMDMYRRCLDAIDRTAPVLAVVDSLATWGIDALTVRGVPFIISISVPPSGFLQDLLPADYPAPMSGLPLRMTPAQRAENERFKLALRQAFTEPDRIRRGMLVAAARRAAGVPNAFGQPSQYARAARALFAYTVFGFEYPFPQAPENLHMLGSVVPRHGVTGQGTELSDWLDSRESVVYIGFGTIMRPSRKQAEALVEVATRLGPRHHVLCKLPGFGDWPIGEQPANLRVEDWLPSQHHVLAHPHVRVFFNHGAANAIHEGLYYDKPQLAMPFWLDCHDGAARLVDSGAGLSLEPRDPLDIDECVSKLHRLLSEPSFRDRAAHWGCRMRTAGGVAAAADLVLAHRDAVGAAP
ncbi:glycosyltransferase [Actinoplanes sp. DH11]|uniref:glycosyltransferase n=1 Tax=Actinoplanes sp. DH11 TaxID=2857011 RepID=UPI001E2A97DB|nr:glycosyltransferase [Actinoplanes sp. DH11]